jgi:hypothetical protein
MLPDENHTYGKPLRPSTPIRMVVNNVYGDYAEQDMHNRYSMLRRTAADYQPQRLSKAHTKASTLAKSHIKQQIKDESLLNNSRDLFKMKKF